ncbi:hypothetical protein [Achromobacter sp. NFACC18-2]|uniref:hypothetical protein n=1 Tax=Achromobacter sp. NFACC18-2 TaxID=1564112 RepID=UPI0011142E94|nr:hypothetical protein [Achromobacter sp. NFACC18-2]
MDDLELANDAALGDGNNVQAKRPRVEQGRLHGDEYGRLHQADHCRDWIARRLQALGNQEELIALTASCVFALSSFRLAVLAPRVKVSALGRTCSKAGIKPKSLARNSYTVSIEYVELIRKIPAYEIFCD